VLQVGQSIVIGQSTNNYDSRHDTRWGGDCPGANAVACTDDPDTAEHSWTNDQDTEQVVYFTVDAYSSGQGAFTLTWTIRDPTASSCSTAVDLLSESSPLDGTTDGGVNSHATSCGGNGNEAVFSAVLQVGQSIVIAQSTNSYDSRHETRWGGDCPGANAVACTDDPDTLQHSWTNDQDTAQVVYFTVDAYSSGQGAFTLTWTIS